MTLSFRAWCHPGVTTLGLLLVGLYTALPQEAASPKLKRLDFAGHQGAVRSLALSPDGRILASTGDDQQLKTWDTATGTLRWSVPVVAKLRAPVAFTPDGTTLAVGDATGLVRLLDVGTGQEQSRLTHTHAVFAVAFSPDGKLLAAAAAQSKVVLWEIATGKEKGMLPVRGWDNCLAFSPDGRTLAVSHSQGIELWSLEPLQRQRTFLHKRGEAPAQDREWCIYQRPVFFADEGRVLVGGLVQGQRPYHDSLGIWDVTTGKLRETVAGVGFPDHFTVSADGKFLLATHGGTASLWDAATGQERVRIGTIDPGWEAHGPVAATIVHAQQDWDLRDGPITAVALAPQGQAIILANTAGRIALWDCSALPPVPAPTAAVLIPGVEQMPGMPQLKGLSLVNREWRLQQAAAFSADGQRLFFAGEYMDPNLAQGKHEPFGFASMWDMKANRELGVIPAPGRMRFGHYQGETLGQVYGLAASPDGKLLAIASAVKITLWDVATRKKVAVLDALWVDSPDGRWSHPLADTPTSLCFSPDSKLLAISANGHTWIWDVQANKRVAHVEGGGGVTFFAEGKCFATAEYHNRVHLWETATGKQLAEDHPMLGILRGVGVSRDNRWLVAGGEGGAKVWEITWEGAKPTLVRRHSLRVAGPVYGLGLSTDGTRALTFGQAFEMWDVATGRQIASLPMAQQARIIAVHGALSPDGKTVAVIGYGGLYLWRP